MNAKAYAKNGMQIRNDERFCSYAILFINVRYLVVAAKKIGYLVLLYSFYFTIRSVFYL